MKFFLVRLKNNCSFKIWNSFIFLIFLGLGTSCPSRNIPLDISLNPVFSEIDTFQTKFGNEVITKYDYFLIRGADDHRNNLKSFLDGVSNVISKRNSYRYNDYLLSFYKEDFHVNERSILAESPEYRYKMFITYRDDNFIACYNYRGSNFFYIDWGPRFENQAK